MSFTIGDKTTELKYPDDFIASSARLQPEIKITDSDVVFVGYGIVAPEYGWDDYKDVDLRGKTLLMLIGDPPIPDPNDPSKLEDKMFKGKAMTYYGRWIYKYENCRTKRRCGRRDHSRDWTGRLSLLSRENKLGQRELRDRCAKQKHGRGRSALLDHTRCREEITGR